MRKIIVNGGARLEGELTIQGSKNSALPVIAAALLAEGKSVIKNCPDIADVRELIAIIQGAGCYCNFKNNELTIEASGLTGDFDYEKCRRFRGSSLLMGAMLGRMGRFILPYPGGCSIGKRPLNYHFEGFERMGILTLEGENIISGWGHPRKKASYRLPYPSVGATENLILAVAKSEGMLILSNCSKEPEVVDLCNYLVSIGADIDGIGTDCITVSGKKHLSGTEYTIPGDRIVCGTYMTACAIAGGNICLKGIDAKRVRAEIEILRKCGSHIFTDDKKNEIIITMDRRPKGIPLIETGPYPLFPTDMQPQIMAFLAYAEGLSLVRDTVFEGRYNTAVELKKMGADTHSTPYGVQICGRETLFGADMVASDLRNGAALVIAALGVRGECRIAGCEHIERGYVDIVSDLAHLGADIRWMNEEEDEEGA